MAMKHQGRFRDKLKAVITLIVGIFLTCNGTVGLALLVDELIDPSIHPVPEVSRRISQQIPNLFLFFALPGGFALVHISARRLKSHKEQKISEGRD